MVQSFINLPFVICLKPSTKAGATRILSIALSHARKSSAAKDNPAKFEQSNKAPNPYALEQVKAPIQRVEGVVWETPVILIGLYGMRRFEILGFCWRNEELGNNMFDISEQIPFKALLKEMTLPKSDGRKLFITEFAAQEAQCEQAERDGKAYYDNDLVVCKPDGSPYLQKIWICRISAFTTCATQRLPICANRRDFYTVGEVLGHTLAGIGVSLE